MSGGSGAILVSQGLFAVPVRRRLAIPPLKFSLTI